MASMANNEIRFCGETEFMKAIHEKFSNAESDGDADGWRNVAIALLVEADIEVNADEVTYPFDSEFDYVEDADGTSELTITFETKWSPDLWFIDALATELPFTAVFLDANESGNAWEAEWKNSELITNKRADYRFSTDEGQIVTLWSFPDTVWDIDGLPVEAEEALTLLFNDCQDEEQVANFIGSYDGFTLSFLARSLKSKNRTVVEAIKELLNEAPREDLEAIIAEIDPTNTDLSQVPKNLLIKLLG